MPISATLRVSTCIATLRTTQLRPDLDGHCGWDLCIVEIGIAIEIGTDVIAGAGVIASGGILGAGGGRAPAGYVPGGSLTDSNGNSFHTYSRFRRMPSSCATALTLSPDNTRRTAASFNSGPYFA